jgi:ATP/maltotriose-dependent transcriptional regulator MalT
VPQAIEVCRQVLSDLGGDQRAEAYVRRSIANLEAMQGRFEEARRLYRDSRRTLEELGWRHGAALTAAAASGPIELLADDPAAAERELRRDYQALDRMGERNYICTTSALLAEALYRQGRFDESEHFTDVTQTLAAADDVTTQVLWRGVRAKLRARQEQFGDARALADEALQIISTAQDPDAQANALLDMGEVLRLERENARAREVVAQAASLFNKKGNIVAEARARTVLESLGS